MSAQADIRKWFMKKPGHDNANKKDSSGKLGSSLPISQSGKADDAADKGSRAYQKESKFFAGDKHKLKLDKGLDAGKRKSEDAGKRKSEEGVNDLAVEKKPSPKKPRLVIPAHEDVPGSKEGSSKANARKSTGQVVNMSPKAKEKETPSKSHTQGNGTLQEKKEEDIRAKNQPRGKGRAKISETHTADRRAEKEEEEPSFKRHSTGAGRAISSSSSPVKSSPDQLSKVPPPGGRGRGAVIGKSEDEDKPSAGRGRGRGRGGGGGMPPWMQARGTPPHKGEKEIPQGAENALTGLTFVISGTLDSLEREEAEFLIKSHGGRVTGSVSKKTDYLLADEDIGGAKSKKAKDLGVKFLTEDELFGMIIASKPKSGSNKKVQAKAPVVSSPIKKEPGDFKGLGNATLSVGRTVTSRMDSESGAADLAVKRSAKEDGEILTVRTPGKAGQETEAWPNKYQPKSTADIIGNPGIVKQLKEWLQRWDASFRRPVGKVTKGRKGGGGSSSSGEKKAVLLSGTPGIGKSTTAQLVCKELGFETVEVNASDTRGKADSQIRKGMGGSTANTIKEMVNNEFLSFGHQKANPPKSVLIMDEVDGMSGGDRGGVADLIASIKSSRVPIICICNDKYSQKLKSLQNYCLPLAYRKPTKQQMAKRLLQVAKAERLQVDEVTLEDIAERTNGDMRMALNQLQYMSLRTRVLKFSDVRSRLLASSKDEDISPFSAVDKLLGYDADRLRMDERVDLHMSDPDLVPLIIQENYLNYLPSAASQDQSGATLMDLVSSAALSIADGDIINVQIRRNQQWQHFQTGAFMSSIIPAALMHGRRIEFEGGRNFNRFPAWLGRNSTYGKKVRLLEDIHLHLLASRICEPTREAIQMGYVPLLALKLSHPLRYLPKETAVEEVVGLLEEYSLTQEDYETIMETSKFKGQCDLLEGVPPAVKTALTKCYKQREQDRRVRSADLLPAVMLPGQKKVAKKPARLNIVDADGLDENGEAEDDQEGEEEEAAEQEEIIDSLLVSKGTTEVTLVDHKKGADGQRGRGTKSKASESKTPRKSVQDVKAIKAGSSASKRKR